MPLKELRYVRDFPYDVPTAFAWLTDYADDDHTRTDAVLERRTVVKREGNVVILDGTIRTIAGRRTGQVDIHLFPPDRWEAHFRSRSGRATVWDYRLTPRLGGGSRLEVVYRFYLKRPITRIGYVLGGAWRSRRQVTRMWDGFDAAMRKELGPRS